MSRTYAEINQAEVDDVMGRLANIAEETRERAIVYGAEAIHAEAQADSPVRTGFLQGSHTVDKRGARAQAGRISRRTPVTVAASALRRRRAVTIGVNASYALPVHETHPTKSRWFVNAVKANFHRVMKGAIKKALREAGNG